MGVGSAVCVVYILVWILVWLIVVELVGLGLG